jgi:hypothetical protein
VTRRRGREVLMPEATAEKLERLARARGTTPGRIVAELLAGVPDPGADGLPEVGPPPEPPSDGKAGRRLRWTREAVLVAVRARWGGRLAGRVGVNAAGRLPPVQASQRLLRAAGIPDTTERNIGTAINGTRRLRLARGYTVAHLAAKAGISPGHLSQLERGLYLPGRGRDAGYPAPPAQIPAGAANALGSYLGFWPQIA